MTVLPTARCTRKKDNMIRAATLSALYFTVMAVFIAAYSLV